MRTKNKDISDERLIEKLKKLYKYDDLQGALVSRKTNRVVWKGLRNTHGYRKVNVYVDGCCIKMYSHRIVWALCHGRFPSQIDHINGCKTDNRLENLREVSREENDQNRLFAWKPNVKTGLPSVFRSNNVFHICLNKTLRFRDRYEAFFFMILLGRMFGEN